MAGPGFSVPFSGRLDSIQGRVSVVQEAPVECCFLEVAEDLVRMEEDLA